MRWLWGRGGENETSERIEALEKAVEGLEHTMRLQKIEWESVLHKVNKVMGRLNASIRKSEAVEDPSDDKQPNLKGVLPAPGSHSVLAKMRGRHGLLSR